MKRIPLLTISGLIWMHASHADILIDSNVKKAKVYSVSTEGARKLLGNTPLKIEVARSGMLLVEKEGHVPTHILLSPGVENVQMKVELKPLKEWSPEYMKMEAASMADKALDRIVQAQALLDERKVASANPLITSLLHDYPGSVAVRILHANSLAISGKPVEALDIYKSLSKELGPSDNELKKLVERMVEGLQKIVTKRRGA
ncbi:MAG TPA: hypothetical protein VNJ08_17840 [Bacteriovoracaceae bacterium]|nr:hypothetical protein [Bacteriovoracaceae bacterium]